MYGPGSGFSWHRGLRRTLVRLVVVAAVRNSRNSVAAH